MNRTSLIHRVGMILSTEWLLKTKELKMELNKYLTEKMPPKELFEPQFCPHPKCPMRGQLPVSENWCKKLGNFSRKDGERIPRWLCRQGEKSHTFSYSSFTLTYWLKNREVFSKIAEIETEQLSTRGMARVLNVSQTCVSNHLIRLGRHFTLFNRMAKRSIDPNKLENLIFDELESWEVSQFTPTTHPLFIDSGSGYKLEFTAHPIRRKGKMTEKQKLQYKIWRKKYPLPSQKSSSNAIRAIIQDLKKIYESKDNVVISTDEKKSYQSILKREWSGISFSHQRFSSKVGRHVGDMGKINQEDQYIRNRSSTMRRQTLDFMRRHNNATLRQSIYMAKRNFVQASCRTQRKSNPAVKLGLIGEPVKWSALLNGRLFNEAEKLPDYLRKFYYQENQTPFFSNNYRHQLIFAD